MEAATVSSTEILVRWDPVIVQGGTQLERYEVQYTQSTFDEIPATNLSSTQGSETELLLENLEEYVSYSISVRAHTNESLGPFSPSVSNTTLEDGKRNVLGQPTMLNSLMLPPFTVCTIL